MGAHVSQRVTRPRRLRARVSVHAKPLHALAYSALYSGVIHYNCHYTYTQQGQQQRTELKAPPPHPFPTATYNNLAK